VQQRTIRLTGKHKTGSIDELTYVANCGCSICTRQCGQKGYGYFEDCRPASHSHPYQITGILMETIFGGVDKSDFSPGCVRGVPFWDTGPRALSIFN
jgi:glutamine synthetase